MKVNTQCVVKYLKHDYKEVGKVVAVIIAAIIVIATVWFICTHGPDFIWPFISPYWKGHNVLNIISTVIVILFTIGISTRDKKFFETKTKNLYGIEVITEETTAFHIGLALLCGFFPYIVYWVLYLLSNLKWEDPLLSTIVFVALILIGTPIGCAIARCKEE